MAHRPDSISQPGPKVFPIPSAKQVAEFLRNNPVQGPSMASFWAVVTVISTVFLVGTFSRGPLATILPILLVLGLMGFLSKRTRETRDIESRINKVQELTMLRRWHDSLQLAWKSLPDLKSSPELHARTIVLIAHDLDQLHQYEAAVEAYNYLIARLPQESVASLHVRAQRAMALLAEGQLSDADQAIRRLKPQRETPRGTPVSAAIYYSRILQSTCTGHSSDVVQLAPDAIAELSPMGIDAGYGYAMLALGYLRLSKRELSQSDPTKNDPVKSVELEQQASIWWKRATTLMSPASLLARYDDLAPLLTVPARPSPIWASPVIPKKATEVILAVAPATTSNVTPDVAPQTTPETVVPAPVTTSETTPVTDSVTPPATTSNLVSQATPESSTDTSAPVVPAPPSIVDATPSTNDTGTDPTKAPHTDSSSDSSSGSSSGSSSDSSSNSSTDSSEVRP